MATLADGGRIDLAAVENEIQRLQQRNHHTALSVSEKTEKLDHPDCLALKDNVDPFDQVQRVYVIQVCRSAHNASEAGRIFFEHSRQKRCRRMLIVCVIILQDLS
ncbi:hypothetical protein [Undibacterium sp. Ji22W]|uniref:hypothetical protein n=1 Tax=Undibacterium sp. Ji22W TaxID=3413038 RepID=UPI003BF1585F